jgi:hypothetical protein
MQTKTCWKCQTIKAIDDFAKNRSRKDGRQTCCRKCKQAYDRADYQRNKERAKNYNKQHRRKNREFVARYLADKQCEQCGFSDSRALDFDHIDPQDKTKIIAKMIHDGTSIKTLKKEIVKCRILCANCHRIHTVKSISVTLFKVRIYSINN